MTTRAKQEHASHANQTYGSYGMFLLYQSLNKFSMNEILDGRPATDDSRARLIENGSKKFNLFFDVDVATL